MGKVIKSFILSALFMALAGTGAVWAEEVLPDLSMESVPAEELSMDAEPQMLGRIESTGISFEVKDSAWLNVSLSSSELIKLTLDPCLI